MRLPTVTEVETVSSGGDGLLGRIHGERESERGTPCKVCRCDALAVVEQRDGSGGSRAQSTRGERAVHGDGGPESTARWRCGTQGEDVRTLRDDCKDAAGGHRCIERITPVTGCDGVLSRR